MLPVTVHNRTKIYNVSGYDEGKLPEWLLQRHRKKLKKDVEFNQRIELIQDFEFPEASNCLKVTPDARSVVGTGVYKPQIRVFDLEEMTIKFERHTNAETIKFECLEDDWKKLLLLQSDKSIEFHTQGGIYYSAKIPKMGRDMIYDKYSCDVLTVGTCSQVMRLNLEDGKFLTSFESTLASVSSIRMNPLHRLLALGSGDSAVVEYMDARSRGSVVGTLDMTMSSLLSFGADRLEVTSLEFLPNGLSLAVGTSNGIVLLYDLRSQKPYAWKDHSNGLPISRIVYHDSRRCILSCDSKIVKIWEPSTCHADAESNELLASVEPPHPINDLCIQPNTGLFMLANEGSQIQSFYIPSLGPAPTWCSFLDNLTEELEENPQPVVYDNYKFVTLGDLQAMGLEHLIGSSVLRAYMHGYFMDFRLYEKAKAIVNPFAYEEYRKKQIEDKLKQERESRIHASTIKNLPSINRSLAEKLLTKQKAKAAADNAGVSQNVDPPEAEMNVQQLIDSRFKKIFQDEDFEVDESSHEYKMLHPSTAAAASAPSSSSSLKKSYPETKTQASTGVQEDTSEDDQVDEFHVNDPKLAVAYPPNQRRRATKKSFGKAKALNKKKGRRT